MNDRKKRRPPSASRREFLRASAISAVGAGLVLNEGIARSAHVAGDETLKIGLVGCGGRGRGADVQALLADPNTRLVALADAFPDHHVLEQVQGVGHDGSSMTVAPSPSE